MTRPESVCWRKEMVLVDTQLADGHLGAELLAAAQEGWWQHVLLGLQDGGGGDHPQGGGNKQDQLDRPWDPQGQTYPKIVEFKEKSLSNLRYFKITLRNIKSPLLFILIKLFLYLIFVKIFGFMQGRTKPLSPVVHPWVYVSKGLLQEL